MRNMTNLIIVALMLASIAFAGQIEFLSSVNYGSVASSELLEDPSFAGEVVFNGDYVYVAFGYGGLVTLDISSPEMPRATSREMIGNVTNLEMIESYLYALDADGNIVVLDVRDASAPVVASIFSIDFHRLVGFQYSESIEGTPYLYTMKYGNSLVAIDISDPTSPSITGETDLRGREANKISQVSDFLAITTDDALVLYDNYFFPDQPRWYTNVDMISGIEDFTANDNIGIIGSSTNGARILRTNDYGDIVTEIASFSGVENAQTVEFWNDFAVVASEEFLNVYDIHALSGTILVDSWSTSNTNHVALNESNGIMIVSKGFAGIEILNARSIFRRNVALRTGWNTVSLPVIPDEGSELSSTVAAFRYDAIEGRYVETHELEPGIGYFYFATGNETIEFSGVTIESSSRSLVPGWNLIGTGSHYVNVEDITSSGMIEPILYYYDNDLETYSVETSVLSPDRSYWVLALDYITIDLENGTTSFGRRTSATYSRNDFSSQPPAAPGGEASSNENNQIDDNVEISNATSPFTYKTNITFEIKNTQNVTARVYDMTGRTIATLSNSEMNSGSHNVSWIPNSNVPSGVYLVAVSSNNEIATKKVILTR